MPNEDLSPARATYRHGDLKRALLDAGVALARDSFRRYLLRSEKDPKSILGRQAREALFRNHPYARPENGTPDSIATITREDLAAHKQRVLARNNLTLGVVGAIAADEIAPLLDKAFGALPMNARIGTIEDVSPALGIRSQLMWP